MAKHPYRQALPALGLSLERHTENVPSDGAWYLLRDGEQFGRYRSQAEAQTAWKEAVDRAGWTPAQREVSAAEVMTRERAERWSRNRAG